MGSSTDKFDWYQSDSDVCIGYMRKKLTDKDVRVEFEKQSVSLFLVTSSGDELLKKFELAHEIVPEKSSYRVSSMKIELRLKKSTDVKWSGIERKLEEQAEAAEAQDLVKKVAHTYPSSSKSTHDWNKLEKQAAELEDEGDPLNSLFQKIYADASDETRRAMIKSFTESQGTVLSTNWGEVGKGKVEMKPPDGMEYKKYEL
ncbi:Suppressor of G2 allele of SKP1 [Fasciola hepatica]|uniref:Suppressor of G2 allele of SKP1 n=1 Tax=Fasciola hepatica TaxID=6192 RepID=A0A4E0QY98_FASHE|nr:Suppressor of G2 allele of SKP1 [Fasciola hepatica]